MITTPLAELEELTGCRFFCLERYSNPDGSSRYFLTSFNNRSLVKIPVLDVRSAGALTSWVNFARSVQGRPQLTEPFNPPTARRILRLMHEVCDATDGTCSIATEGVRND